MLNVAVWPYSTGEVVLQNYNVLLTLNSLLSHSDGILPVYNDDMLSTCKNLLKVPRPSYKLMNTVLAQSLLSIMYPVANNTADKLTVWSTKQPNQLESIIANLCSNPSYKMLSLRNIP